MVLCDKPSGVPGNHHMRKRTKLTKDQTSTVSCEECHIGLNAMITGICIQYIFPFVAREVVGHVSIPAVI